MKYHKDSFLKAKHLSEGEIKFKISAACAISPAIAVFKPIAKWGNPFYSLLSIHLAGLGQICSYVYSITALYYSSTSPHPAVQTIHLCNPA